MSRRAALLLEAVLLASVLAGGAWLRVRLGAGWAYGGADTWAYVGTAVEVRTTGRYAVRLPDWFNAPKTPPPLSYCRLPGYPLFLNAVGTPDLRHNGSWVASTKRAQIALDLLSCVLVFGLARVLGGRRAAWPAVLLTAGSPLLALYTASMMPETLAAALATAVVLALALALDDAPPRRALWLQVGAGVLCGLSMLVRPDGLLLAPCLLVPLVVGAAPWRRRARDTGLALLGCALVFAPWPLRNMVRFGAPHAYGAVCDREARPMVRTRFLTWFGTWIVKEEHLPKTLWAFYRPNANPNPSDFPPEAFASPWERQVFERIVALRAKVGHSAVVDGYLHDLGVYRLVADQLRSLVVLPARRAFYLWVSPHDQSLRAQEGRPLPAIVRAVRPHLGGIAVAQTTLALLGLAVLLLPARRGGRRRLALLLVVALGSRTAFLALTGMVEGRYVVEAMPVALALGGVALGWVAGRAWRARPWSRAPERLL